MKKLIVLFGIMALLTGGIFASSSFPQDDKEVVKLLVSPEFSELVNKWITEYSADNPGKEIIIAGIDDRTGAYNLNEDGTLGIVSEEYLHSLGGRESLWSMVVARDVIVPVISSDNPFNDIIAVKGISPGKFAGVYTEEDKLTWGRVLDTEDKTPVSCYCLGSEPVKFCLSQFLNSESLKGNPVTVASTDELIKSIKEDRYSIGFSRLSALIDYEHNSIIEGLQLVPIDINGNGTLEHNENIYTCLNDFNRGVWIGKYPGSLCRNIHIVSAGSPVDANEKGFISWVLSGGQAYISEAGFSELIPGERQPKIQALNAGDGAVVSSVQQPVRTARIILIIATVVLAGIVVYIILKLFRSRAKDTVELIKGHTNVYDEKSVVAPRGLFFDKSHTWAYMEKEGKVRVGVDDFLQHTTGRITRVELKSPGARVKKGEKAGSLIQDGKRLDIYSPVSGVVADINHELSVNPSLINSDPLSGGWMYTVEPNDWRKEMKKYFMGESYMEWIKSEFARLKDFIAVDVRSDEVNYAHVILQEGGEIRDGLLENFGPDIWEEFQRKFMDSSL